MTIVSKIKLINKHSTIFFESEFLFRWHDTNQIVKDAVATLSHCLLGRDGNLVTRIGCQCSAWAVSSLFRAPGGVFWRDKTSKPGTDNSPRRPFATTTERKR